MKAVTATFDALQGVEIPETLLRQYIPGFTAGVKARRDADGVLEQAVDRVLASYDTACLKDRSKR